ncbi:MAG: hypothetical protein MMC33_009338 [Icmadophila ericetorum]|nr:hypothetical protein [Icmadophila ericetorum]
MNRTFLSLSPLASPTTTEPKELFPKLTLYTNGASPWGHRVQITLKELKLPYERVHVAMSKPREEWYLKLNSRGQIPTLKISREGITNQTKKDIILTESAVICQFLADAFPQPTFYPASSSPSGPLIRAQTACLLEVMNTRIQPPLTAAFKAPPEEKEAATKHFIAVLKAEIEPLLEDCNPFFAGSKTVTLAEALFAPFVSRMSMYTRDGKYDHFHVCWLEEVVRECPRFKAWEETICAAESVRETWDEEDMAMYLKGKNL